MQAFERLHAELGDQIVENKEGQAPSCARTGSGHQGSLGSARTHRWLSGHVSCGRCRPHWCPWVSQVSAVEREACSPLLRKQYAPVQSRHYRSCQKHKPTAPRGHYSDFGSRSWSCKSSTSSLSRFLVKGSLGSAASRRDWSGRRCNSLLSVLSATISAPSVYVRENRKLFRTIFSSARNWQSCGHAAIAQHRDRQSAARRLTLPPHRGARRRLPIFRNDRQSR
jgi:hypothetical protein